MLILRPYQLDDIERLRDAFRKHRRVVYRAATGSGKTCCAAEMIRSAVSRGRKVLVCTHRVEIHRQTVDKLREAGLHPAELVAGSKVPDAQLIAASIQTLARREIPAADLVIVDEAHANHTQQARIQAALPNAWHLLLTATPARLDGKPLAADVIVQGPSITSLIDAGYLVPTVFYGAETPDLHGVAFQGGDYAQDGLQVAYQSPRLVGAVPDTWLRLARGRRTVTFATGIEHSKRLVDAYTAAGVRAIHVDGSTPDSERAGAWDRLRTHDVDVVCNVGVAVEGLDVPSIECVQFARATASLTVWFQSVGRGMRPSPGKRDLVVLDHGGCAWRLGLPEQDKEWSLTETVGAKRAAAVEGLRTCKACLAIWSATAGMVCPRCGEAVQVASRPDPKQTGGELVQITAAELERQKRVASKDVPPRDPPDWVVRNKLTWYWNMREGERAARGLALPEPGKRFSGYSESGCWLKMRKR